ncbi:MAG TPA: CdaR family protein [Candidatus Limnocylindrales bacterium]|nr:CdaR family protein [Candidatus Limnocylindrales bacterium]
MKRLLGRFVHNWPLKLAAVGLATLLYGGLVVSQSTRTLSDLVIQIDVVGQPTDGFMLTSIDPVTEIRYFAPSGTRPLSSDFEATVDVSGIKPGSGPQRVPVHVTSIDDRITVVGVTPAAVTVDLDRLAQKTVDVVVDHGPTPPGLELGDETVDPERVTVSGPSTAIKRVVAARASVVIQPSGIDVDRDFDLVAVDDLGEAVGQVDIEPGATHVTIPVFSDRETRTLPVNPVVTGDPAPGFEIASVTVEPPVMLVEGDADQLAELVRVDTEQIPMTGVSSDLTVSVGLDLPTGVLAVGNDQISVTVTLRPVTATRTFSAGVRLIGAGRGLSYAVDADRILVTVGGSVADLDRLSGTALVVDLDVSGLGPGTASVPVALDLPTGATLISASPSSVNVTITGPPPSPSPGATPSPSAGG